MKPRPRFIVSFKDYDNKIQYIRDYDSSFIAYSQKFKNATTFTHRQLTLFLGIVKSHNSMHNKLRIRRI